MKALATKILIFLYFTTSTQFSELYKLPVFVSHFIEHYQGGNVANEMIDFVVLHYNNHEKDEDWKTDQKLPFIKIEEIHEPMTSFDEDFIFFHYLDTIWQPPKQA